MSQLSTQSSSKPSALQRVVARRLAAIQAKSRASEETVEIVDPIEFIRLKLGDKLWSRQRQLVQSTWANTITGCISGQKTGKTRVAADIAITWCKTHKDGIVRLASASEDQLIDGLWGEVRRLLNQHPELGPPPALAPSTGWRLSENQKIIGVTAKEANRAAGRSGAEQLWIVDEACGIDYPLWEVIIGNLMGGGHLLWLTNPVTIGGKIYEWDTNPDSAANVIRIDARETPNFEFLPDGTPNEDFEPEGVAGLATPDGVENIRRDYGEDSPEFDVRVKGRFPRQGSNVAIQLHLVEDAIKRHGTVVATGPLVLGVDVARYGDDDSSINPRRGLYAYEPVTLHGLPITSKDTEKCLATEVLRVAKEMRQGTEDVNISVDSSGLGAGLVDALLALDDKDWGWLVIIPVNAAETADECCKYFNRRTELWFNGRDWFKAGGAIPNHQRLKGELIAPRYGFDPKNRQKLESKDDIKKRTKKSPDVAEGFLLSLVNPPPPANYDAKACVRTYQSPLNY